MREMEYGGLVRERCYSRTDLFISFKLILVCNHWAVVLYVLHASHWLETGVMYVLGSQIILSLGLLWIPLPNVISEHRLFSSRKPTQECWWEISTWASLSFHPDHQVRIWEGGGIKKVRKANILMTSWVFFFNWDLNSDKSQHFGPGYNQGFLKEREPES